MRFAFAPLVPLSLALSACAVSETARPVGPYLGSRAYFADYPADLLDAAAETCSQPSDTVVRPRKGWVQCQRLLPPGPTAAAILKYDGTVENLPVLVISFRSDASGSGYIVTNENYLNVPQTDGSDLHVVQPDAGLSRRMLRLFGAAGGQPLAEDGP